MIYIRTYIRTYIHTYIHTYIFENLKKKKIKYNNNNGLVLYFLVLNVNSQQTNQDQPHIFSFVNFCLTYFIKIKSLS